MSMFKIWAAALVCVTGTLSSAARATPPGTAPVQASSPAAGSTPGEQAFAALDANKDKTLSLAEFQVGYARMLQATALEARLREQFLSLDTDRSGAIERAEYDRLALVKRAGALAPALSTFDGNTNRKLEFSEYVAAVRAMATSQQAAAQKAAPAKK
jgi:hypothetical protein